MNILVALASESHVHRPLVASWFMRNPDLQWALCAFTEAGFLRIATAPRPGQVSVAEAAAVLASMAHHPGYAYIPLAFDWRLLSSPFLQRIQGTKQITDAYLLGLCIHEDLILATLDKAFLHLAGKQFRSHIHLLQQ